MPPTEYHGHLAEHGGMCSCGDGLGVMVGTDVSACPAGWIFVDLKDSRTTPELVLSCIEEAKSGRSAWPTRDGGKRP